MKLNKKFLASFMAMTMVAAPMSAYADNYVITGTGNVTTLETKIYNVVLPTSDSIDFNVDPYGLTELEGEVSLDQLILSAGGMVTSSATAVINKSSMPLNISMELFFDNTAASNSAVTLAALDKVKANEGDLYLEVVPMSGTTLSKVVTGTSLAVSADAIGLPVSDKAFTLSSAPLSISDAGVAVTGVAITATGSAATASGTVITFPLGDVADAYYVQTGGAADAVTAEAVLSEAAIKYDSNNVYSFAIAGYANPNSSVWLDMARTKDNPTGAHLELSVKFTISDADNDADNAYAFIADNGTMYVGIQSNTNITDGGMTNYSLLKDVKLNGTSITPYSSKLFVGNFALVSGSYKSGDVITFTYDNTAYKVTVPTS